MNAIRTLLRATALAGTVAIALPATADAPITRVIEGSFDDATTAVESAIINAGLVIEGHSEVGAMLARTKADVGGAEDVFLNAEVFTLCSATVSRTVMERDPLNIQLCPYAIFAFETPDAPGRIIIGHADYASRGAPEVNDLLDPILDEAAAW